MYENFVKMDQAKLARKCVNAKLHHKDILFCLEHAPAI